jgi:hypothetical protein
MKLLIMKFSPLPCYLVSLRPKYSPQHPILKHPQPTFLPQLQHVRELPDKIKLLHTSYLAPKYMQKRWNTPIYGNVTITQFYFFAHLSASLQIWNLSRLEEIRWLIFHIVVLVTKYL